MRGIISNSPGPSGLAGVQAAVVGPTTSGEPEPVAGLNVASYDTVHVFLEGSRASESWTRHAKRYLAEFCSFLYFSLLLLVETLSKRNDAARGLTITTIEVSVSREQLDRIRKRYEFLRRIEQYRA